MTEHGINTSIDLSTMGMFHLKILLTFLPLAMLLWWSKRNVTQLNVV